MLLMSCLVLNVTWKAITSLRVYAINNRGWRMPLIVFLLSLIRTAYDLVTNLPPNYSELHVWLNGALVWHRDEDGHDFAPTPRLCRREHVLNEWLVRVPIHLCDVHNSISALGVCSHLHNILSRSDNRCEVLIASIVCSCVADALVIIVTWRRTYRATRLNCQEDRGLTMSFLVLRDGK